MCDVCKKKMTGGELMAQIFSFRWWKMNVGLFKNFDYCKKHLREVNQNGKSTS